MDGNGRWANRRHLPRVAGHKAGVAPVRSTVETCARLGIGDLTLYAFSCENWKRPRAEVDTLWHLLRYYLRKELPELQQHGVRLRAIGRVEALPAEVREELLAVVEETAANTGLRVNLAINYRGRAEMVDAVNAILDRARAAGSLETCAWMKLSSSATFTLRRRRIPTCSSAPPGELRVSNFLLWQIAYSEIYVTDTLWPDFDRAELLRSLLAYQKRDRGTAASSSTARCPAWPRPT